MLLVQSSSAQTNAEIIVERVNEVICLLLNVIWWIIGLLATLALIVYGMEYMATEDVEKRNEIKSRIVHVVIGLVVVIVAMPFVNYLIENTEIVPFECDENTSTTTTPTSTTITSTTTTPTSTTITSTTTTTSTTTSTTTTTCPQFWCPDFPIPSYLDCAKVEYVYGCLFINDACCSGTCGARAYCCRCYNICC